MIVVKILALEIPVQFALFSMICCNFWQSIALSHWRNLFFFGVFAPQELGTYLVLGTPFGGTKLAPTSE